MLPHKLATLFMLLLLLSVPLGYGDLTKTHQEGSWEICSINHFKKSSDVSNGLAIWEDTIYNFSGFKMQINFSELYCVRREWWHESAVQGIEFRLKFNGNVSGDDFEIYVSFEDWQRLWGGQWGRWVASGVRYHNWDSYLDPYDYFLNKNVEVWVYLTNNNLTANIKVFNYQEGLSKPVLIRHVSFNFTDNSWNEKVDLTIEIEHYGSGWFEGYSNYWYEANPEQIPEEASWEEQNFWNFVNDLVRLFEGSIPQEIKEFVKAASGWWTYLYGVLNVVWVVVLQFIPILPFILFFWILDAAITSVVQGDLHPIGVVVMTIWNTARGIIDTLISIGKAIADLLPFGGD